MSATAVRSTAAGLVTGVEWDPVEVRELLRLLPGRARRPLHRADFRAGFATDAKPLHCLSAHCGPEVSEEVNDSPRLIVYEEAENR